MGVLIRKVRSGDESVLAQIQTESWKAAFCHILDGDTLKRCTDLARAKAMYQSLLEEKTGNGYLLTVDAEPQCIAWWDAARDPDLQGKAELICIHSLPGRWRRGYGTMMMDLVLQDIRNEGYTQVALWVFKDNIRALAFYEAMGFKTTDKTKPALGTEEVRCMKTL